MQEQANKLTTIEDNLQQLSSLLQSKTEGDGDTGDITKMRASIKSLKAEISHLSVAIGLASSLLIDKAKDAAKLQRQKKAKKKHGHKLENSTEEF